MPEYDFRCPECDTVWPYMAVVRQQKCPNDGCIVVVQFDPPIQGHVVWRTVNLSGPLPPRSGILEPAAG